MNAEENKPQSERIEKDSMNEYYEMVKKASNTSEELANGLSDICLKWVYTLNSN